MQASNIFSIGGSLSINCHGWDHKTGTLKDTVHSLLIADSQGKIQRLYPGEELFDLVIGGLGGFGAILEAEISLATNTKMSLETQELPTEDYLAYFQKEVVSNPDIGMHHFRLSLDPKRLFESGIVLNYIEEKPLPVISKLKNEPERGNLAERIELGILRRLDCALLIAWKVEKKSALKDIKTDRNEAMTFPLKCIFNESTLDVEWLQEYFVKGSELNDFIHYLSQTLKENEVAVYNASVRYVKKNECAGFSYSRDEDMFAIVIFFNQSLTYRNPQNTSLGSIGCRLFV